VARLSIRAILAGSARIWRKDLWSLTLLAAALELPLVVADVAHQSASGFVNYVTPTSAVVMGGLTLAKVGYDRYIRFVAPFLAIMFVALCLFVGIGAVL